MRSARELISRAFLESVSIARAVLEESLLDACDPARLSPAANTILGWLAESGPFVGISQIVCASLAMTRTSSNCANALPQSRCST